MYKNIFFLFIIFFTVIIANVTKAEELPSLPLYDWSKILKLPPLEYPNEGHQILHFRHNDKPYYFNKEAVEFVDKYLIKAKRFETDADVLRYASEVVSVNGVFIELGSGSGKTINFIAALNPTKKIYGFDAFTQGLPERWDRPDIEIPTGTFAFKDQQTSPPPVLDNVLLYDGGFDKTLPLFKKVNLKDTPIAFLHVDSDIYLSAKQAFDVLGENIVPGTIIVFDEFYNYPNSENHEFKAFEELVKKHKLNYEYIAFNVNHEQVVARIK